MTIAKYPTRSLEDSIRTFNDFIWM